MKCALLSFVSLVLMCIGCTRPMTTPQPVAVDGRAIAVFPPNNRTGDDLLIAGASFFEKYALRSDRVTVPDVVAAQARVQLARHGFRVLAPEAVEAATGGRAPDDTEHAAAVAAHGHIDGEVLYIEIRRWEPDVPFRPTFVIVSVQMRLIDPSNGRVLWHAEHVARPVQTPGSVIVGDAYAVAAERVVAEMMAAMEPGPPLR